MKETRASTKDPENERRVPKKSAVLQRLRQRFAHVPAGVSLADDLISERRSESQREG